MHFLLESTALLGHSWGSLLALEYAIRHPGRVSHLILMATPPASHDGHMLFRQEPRKRGSGDAEKLQALASDPGYQEGDPGIVAEYFRTHFRATLKQPGLLEILVENLMSDLTKENIVKGRAISKRLSDETWLSSQYNLLPMLHRLSIPTLVIHGDYDSIPAKYAVQVADAIPGARFVLLQDCGHFAYLECPDEVRKEIESFFAA
jgi:proline iminopeptidase